MIGKEYTCSRCGETFKSAWTDEDAKAEKDKLWGDVPMDECVIICDDCFNNAMKRFN